MLQDYLQVEEFIRSYKDKNLALIDVRSEAEFAHAHFPGAINVPILNNDERVIVGTTYKQQGRVNAVLKGLELVAPRFHTMLEETSGKIQGEQVLLYCWRGGMRSGIMSWLLSLGGFKPQLLTGGYKAFRRFVLEQFSHYRKLIVLGGKTGSGKTTLLQLLQQRGEQIIDLEAIANHKGSAFGHLGQPPQPSTEQFENLLALALYQTDPERRVWIENESRHVGSCMIPDAIFQFIREAPVVEAVVSTAERKSRIANEYGIFDSELLIGCTEKIAKRLGPQHAKAGIELLREGNFEGWLEIVLDYYDRTYGFSNDQRNPDMVKSVTLSHQDSEKAVKDILSTADKLNQKQNIF